MSKVLLYGVIISVFLTVLFTWISILTGFSGKQDFLELTKVLLSWKVISGGITVGAVSTFRKEIEAVLAALRTRLSP